MFSFQSCQEATAPGTHEIFKPASSFPKKVELTLKEKKELNLLLKNIAKGLAILFMEKSNRHLLETAIRSSDKKEQILEASEFLNEVNTIKVNGTKKRLSIREAITDFLPNAIKETFNKKIQNLKFGLIDIYFPIKDWRLNWESNKKLQVAAVCWNEKLRKREVYAYTNDGDEKTLPLDIKPEIATLVVYPSEKQGNYKPNKDNYYKSLSKSNALASTNNEAGGGYYTYKVNKVTVNQDYDWPEGTMEIYIRYRYRPKYDYRNWSGWYNTETVDVVKKTETDFNQVLRSYYDILSVPHVLNRFINNLRCNNILSSLFI